MKLIKILLFLHMFSLSFNQINTEAMRNNSQILGLNQQLNLSFSYISGSSEFLMLHGNYRADYHVNDKWHGFFIMNHDRAHEKSNEDFNNRGFAHIRVLNHWKPKIHIESFLQKEYNYFIDLENRELIGGGLRINPIDELHIGIGFMNEVEVYQYSSMEHVNLKSTNYINHTFKPNDSMAIRNIIYYQFKSTNLGHYRILWDGNINIEATDKISFHINLKFRYDMSDINPDGNSFFEITNGLGFYF